MKSTDYSTGSALVTLVTPDDTVIGSAPVLQAHQHPAQLHRAISVWLYDTENKTILFQQRSPHKIIGAGWWANTVCGNVRPDETYRECAVRRLHEELGLQIEADRLVPDQKIHYRAYCNPVFGEHEVDQIYFLHAHPDDRLALNPREVQATAWLSLETIHRLRDLAHEHLITTTQSRQLSLADLRANTPSLSLTIDGSTHIFAPWSLMMLLEPQFIEQLSAVGET